MWREETCGKVLWHSGVPADGGNTPHGAKGQRPPQHLIYTPESGQRLGIVAQMSVCVVTDRCEPTVWLHTNEMGAAASARRAVSEAGGRPRERRPVV